MNITVVGLGYVGLPLALLLAEHHDVTGLDTDETKLNMLRSGSSPFKEDDILPLLKQNKLRFPQSAEDKAQAYRDADFIVIAVPTNYDEETDALDARSLNEVISQALSAGSEAAFIIKSTVPIGFTAGARAAHGYEKIYFSPEFLREGKAVYDNWYPSRIIVGREDENSRTFAELLQKVSKKRDVEVIFMSDSEAESVKLFSNTYLAMRVAFFNELDTFAECKSLRTEKIVQGVCADPRIGNYYNNPSFGYGGYCLPKDSKQLSASYGDIPNEIIRATVSANAVRMEHIAERVMALNPGSVGIFRLQAKAGADNVKQSAIIGVMEILRKKGIPLQIYEPLIEGESFDGVPVTGDLESFKRQSDVILCNRRSEELDDVAHKTYTKDLFGVC